MRLVAAFLLTLILSLPVSAKPKLLWETKGLAQPESVVMDPATGVLYVSNIAGAIMQKDGNGFIAKMRPDGTMIEKEWVKGLDAPSGLALHDRTLYAADVDQLVAINVASGDIIKRYPAEGALFLNGIATDEAGTVYVSDTPTNTIWRLKDGQFEPWLTNDALNKPNGLLVEGNTLIVAPFGDMAEGGQEGKLGALLAVSLEDQSIKPLGNGEAIGNLDGLEAVEPGIYLVTDWASGGLFRVTAKGDVQRLLPLRQGNADFIYLPETNTVLIPMMMNNSLVAYKLD
ncbi:MAG: hypothetical protein FJX44_07070 [Alphaproteobacteria bacterium]|nr:hypothetical protein [Alphaproteobacteria bacterium]